MDKEQRTKRLIELLEKEDFDCKDYDELKNLIDEDEKEYYDMKDKFMKAVYGMK